MKRLPLVALVVLTATAGAGAMHLFTLSPSSMVEVAQGHAILGAPDRNSLPGPAIYDVPAFKIDRREVTNTDYNEFIKATGHPPAAFADDDEFNQPDQPVTGVTWDDARKYCAWKGKRLPSEIEWEKAARGADARIYHG